MIYGNGKGLWPLGTTKGTGMIMLGILKTFAVFKHFNSGVRVGAGLTKLVALIPNKNDSISAGL